MKIKILLYIFCSILFLSSCESDSQKKERLELEEQQQTAKEEQRQEEERAAQLRLAFKEQERKEKEAELARLREIKNEKARIERETIEKYKNNSLNTGVTPYSYCYSGNNSCSSPGCSEIKVKTPYNSDVLVTIKKNNEVFRHAYIRAGASYTFQMPNGIYQPFFYYGTGWNPQKIMKETTCGTLKGGFVAEEHVGKDSPQTLNNNILQYELVLQQNGNFSTQASNPEEAL